MVATVASTAFSFSTGQSVFTGLELSAAGCSPLGLSYSAYLYFASSASTFFMYFAGSLLKSLTQSAQQKAIVLPL